MKVKILPRIIAGILFISLCSCMKIKSKNEGPHDESIPVASIPGKVDVSYPSQGPNEYQVKFIFHSAPATVFMTKTIKGIKSSDWIKLDNESWIDEKVKAGTLIHYEFGNLNQNQFAPWESLDIKVPEDLVIDQALDFSQQSFRVLFTDTQNTLMMKQFTRIYFTSGGSITLDGQSVQIEAQEIHSENGLIQTFPFGAKAALGRPGRDGGVLQIKALRATGVLKIEMRGENGGDGALALSPDLSLKGEQGSIGEPGTLAQVIFDPALALPVATCGKQPTRGLAGQKGLQGYSGGNGKKGGASGSLFIEISEFNNFSVLSLPFVGQGGEGALGGEGGAGGDGGPAGALPSAPANSIIRCDQIIGPMGPKGDRGNPGQHGADGEIQTFIFNQKSMR